MAPTTSLVTEPALADHRFDAAVDDVIDLTDRRRLLVQLVFGVDVDPNVVDHLFDLELRSIEA